MEQLKKEIKPPFSGLARRIAALALAAAMAIGLCGCEQDAASLAQNAAETLTSAAEAASGIISDATGAASGILSDAAGAAAGSAAANDGSPAVQPDIDGSFKMSFIDVGQALSVLVECDGQFMLYDGGNVDDGPLLVSYLQSQNVGRLEYVFGSHAHEDHIGGLSSVFENYTVGHVYSPVAEADSTCFDYFASDAAAAGCTLEVPAVGTVWQLGGATVRLLGPLKQYEETNNTSLVLRVDYGSTSFLLTGDMQSEAESDLVESGANLKADVLQVGHHGSYSSTSYMFLNAVLPEIAVISCGTNNDYGHPHEETLSRLRDAGVDVYRTDLMGTITITSDGANYSVGYERFAEDEQLNPTVTDSAHSSAVGYIGNINSKKFHLPTCPDLPSEKNQIIFSSYAEAVNAGYTPHSGCIN